MKVFNIIAIITLLASCSNKSRPVVSQPQQKVFKVNGLLSDSETLTMVKLKVPALFSTAIVKDGVIKVDPKNLESLKKEQAKFLEDVKNISDKIEVLYRYQYVLNGFTLKTPTEFEDKIQKLSSVAATQQTTQIAQPIKRISIDEVKQSYEKGFKSLLEKTSVNFVGVDEVRKKFKFFGEGLEVGVIDSGIDYTHSMFAGPGTEEAFESVDPLLDAPSELFPSDKIVGGIDLVGDNYQPQSKNPKTKLPLPDSNPIDISGHGSHVAGTVAGIGDDENSFDGVAAAAKLHAIKVFGGGSTGDFIVIAGFEYAADPNNDDDPSDALDVLNLSLGGAYGIPGNMYESAISNLANVGIAVVASAGNSGDNSYITGAPATSDDALSVGASIDNMPHNWSFDAVSFSSSEFEQKLVTEFGKASFAKPLSDFNTVKGKLVFAGVADQDFSDELKEKVAGNIALIDRGKVSFIDKVKRALDAKAIAVVIANNQPDGVIEMGGASDETLAIPAVMISMAQGDQIKKAMESADVLADLKEPAKIEKPELIDTLTGFSSRGPRSLDSAIKPEIVGPGQQIISAMAGGGKKIVKMNGTSMSGPLLAGVMTLMKEAYPNQSVKERKAILIGSAKPISDKENNMYPVSRQGAGRVQVLNAVEAKLFATPATLALGEVSVKSAIVIRKTVTLNNLSENTVTLTPKIIMANKLEVTMPSTVVIEGNSSKKVKLEFKIDGTKLKQVDETDAIISFQNNEKNLIIPVLAVAKKTSEISATKLEVLASAGADDGAAVDLELKNTSIHDGLALIFNKLAEDERRTPNLDLINLRNNFCDLHSAGYRIVTLEGKEILEVAVKTYGPQEVWNGCSASILVDSDGDDVADQEVLGTTNGSMPGLTSAVPSFKEEDFQSFLIDSKKANAIRLKHEQDQIAGNDQAKLDLVPALEDLQTFEKYDHSTVSIIRADLAMLRKTSDGQIRFKVAVNSSDYEVNERDDFAGDEKTWTKLNVFKSEGAYEGIPASVTVKANSTEKVELTKGEGPGEMIIYYPFNITTRSLVLDDETQQLVKPTYKF